MYLFFFEDGDISKSQDVPTEGDKNACDDGYMDIIDISDPMTPKIYYNGEWLDVAETEE